MNLEVIRQSLKLAPDPTRVFSKFFFPGTPERAKSLISKVIGLPHESCRAMLNQTLREFSGRHRNISQIFEKHFNNIQYLLHELNIKAEDLRYEKKLIIGSYFTAEYAIEAAAIFNPSIMKSPDQSNLEYEQTRVIISLRATGEGHISSIVFREGIIDKNHNITLDPQGVYVDQPNAIRNFVYDKNNFYRKLEEMNIKKNIVTKIMDQLPNEFEYPQLEEVIQKSIKGQKLSDSKKHVIQSIKWLADSHYEITFSLDTSLSERVLYPTSSFESNGIEDARFVRFTYDDGSVMYYATYTAYDGHTILPKLLETIDFYKFRVMPLHGKMSHNKGMALFPRKIKDKYAMISRIDGWNNYIMYSDNINVWEKSKIIQSPEFPWELVQIGNCGSPIETEKGWLVITHGVGPVRKYCLGAILLDLDNPEIVIGQLDHPILCPNENEREGYVPNVVYSCGCIAVNDVLIIPYAASDTSSSFASIKLDVLLEELINSPYPLEKPKRRSKILLVEDQLTTQEQIKQVLLSGDYNVECALNGLDAMILLAQKEFDLVVSDINMPTLNGYQLMELMSEKKMNIPIVFISEKYDEEWIVNGVNENVLEVLPKPIDKEQLLLKVHRLLNDEFFDFYSGDDIG
ncbi:MAG: response regulator [Prolixibacteraceae bacterium]|jgi:predicted GH43/DUF377 family glycosyl hydrolase/ActR/RegA family two-component response regulator|nr:response regulator [Prolixibacteraceae bacterium]